ncbi:MAG TPA: FAD-dependent oxidoreductase [Vineibacter sp.]|nr:FAD-dependent oxidoreductase [Vineibacter sp.]
MPPPLPTQARIVIIGAGAIGCSIAYHLVKHGERDVLVLEKSGITHGSTWHAAGLVGQLRSRRNLTRMMQQSVALYGELEKELGHSVDWHPVGSLRLASSQDRWSEIKRTATIARSFGFELQLVSAGEARQIFPYIQTDGVEGAAFIPSDGYIDPSSLTQALARLARQGGARIVEGVRVTGIDLANGRATAVRTDQGRVRCELLVNAAGIWAREVAAMMGVRMPVAAIEHQYMVTEKRADVPRTLTSLRDPDNNFYLKPEAGGFAIGGWEAGAPPFGRDGVPFDFGRELFAGNFDRFEHIATPATRRLPLLNELGVRQLINGPIPVTPDGEPIMGKAPELENVFVAGGFTSGIAAAGGAGRQMAHWILHGAPEFDLWSFDVRRFGPHHAGRRYLHERAVEAYHRYYLIHWPGEEMASGRGGRRSPLYGALKDAGAVFGSRFGWERPNWFAADGEARVDQPSFEGTPNWFAAVARECRAIREHVALIDQSSFSKVEIEGPGAAAFLQRLAAGNLDKPDGALVYTQLCNEQGGIEADLTFMRLARDRFYMVTGSAFGIHDTGWLRRHLPDDGSVRLTDVTNAWAVINCCGPLSRDLIARLADGDVSNAALPYMAMREMRLGLASVRVARVTYVGELGYELHVPVEYALHLYEELWRAGQDLGVANAGYRAIESCRLEKRYLYWGADIGPDDTPFEAGLSFAVAMSKGDFIGRAALQRAKAAGPQRRLCVFVSSADVPLYGSEAILRDGEVLGVTTSAGYGHTVGKWIAFGYLPASAATHRDFEIEAFTRRFPVTRIDAAAYDPERKRILA